MTFRAIYSGGVLRPMQPLALTDGAIVEISVQPLGLSTEPLAPPTAEEDSYRQRLHSAQSLEEMLAIMETAPPLPAGYDLSRALNLNRKLIEERPLYQDEEGERGS